MQRGQAYSIVGSPVVEAVCLPVGSEFKVNVYDTFGDGMCGSCYGGVDGNLFVSNLCGDELYYVGDTTQYESIGSDIIVVDPCFPPIPQGCTDPWFTEYDPSAVIDDGSCQTEVILGCTDPGAINFNEDANTLETEDNCDFTLTLTDGAGDGWFGSWIGVQQGDEIWGPFTMYPADEFEKEIQIPLYSGEAVNVMFFTQGNAETTASQCGFYFDGPNGVFMEGGTNPWSDAIKKFPFKYNGVPVCGDFCVPGIQGCTLSFACNYNPEANVDGDCTFPIEYYGCDNECINDTDGDGVCDELEVVGCQDPTAFNYNESATDPAECEEVVLDALTPPCSTTTSWRTQRTTAASHSSTDARFQRPSTTTPWPTPTTEAASFQCLVAWILTLPTTMYTPTCLLTRNACTTLGVSLVLANHTGPTTTATLG